jgi:hypothetical protein
LSSELFCQPSKLLIGFTRCIVRPYREITGSLWGQPFLMLAYQPRNFGTYINISSKTLPISSFHKRFFPRSKLSLEVFEIPGCSTVVGAGYDNDESELESPQLLLDTRMRSSSLNLLNWVFMC